MKLIFLFPLIFLFSLSCGNDDTLSINALPEQFDEEQIEEGVEEPIVETAEEIVEELLDESSENLLLRLKGAQIVDAQQRPVNLQGVAFSNFVWSNNLIPHHTEIDFQRVRDMGMNTIRFYMNYKYFEDDSNTYTYKQSGWDWLDQNIEWAKKHNIYLILNMHIPQGGYQSRGEGDALWNSMENQNRLIALWKAIAERYKDESQIAGYGPLNEPFPSASINQWSMLAQNLINGIREVDENHILFIEQAIEIKGQPDTENYNFPDVNGNAIAYEFHGYSPYLYTHQLLEFTALGDGGKYPDDTLIETSSEEWYTSILNNPKLIKDNSDWTFYQGERFQIKDKKIKIAVPTVVGAEVDGIVFFDDMIIKEYDENENFVRDIPNINLNDDDGWFFWSENNRGSGGLSKQEGRNDSNSLFVSNTTENSNLSNFIHHFIPKQNYFYEVNGWMKGVNVAHDNGAELRLDFYTQEEEVLVRNKNYLETEIGKIVAWAENKNVALFMGEFGAGNPCFKNNKGGLQFVEDMVDILKTNNIHFTYHTYHEDPFGIYLGDKLPDASNVNQDLIDWFIANLN